MGHRDLFVCGRRVAHYVLSQAAIVNKPCWAALRTHRVAFAARRAVYLGGKALITDENISTPIGALHLSNTVPDVSNQIDPSVTEQEAGLEGSTT